MTAGLDRLRGSTPAKRHNARTIAALTGNPGPTELEDVAAVYDSLVAEGVVDPTRTLLTGGSWGGFLTLLGLGTQPEPYAPGTWGPPSADALMARDGRSWRRP